MFYLVAANLAAIKVSTPFDAKRCATAIARDDRLSKCGGLAVRQMTRSRWILFWGRWSRTEMIASPKRTAHEDSIGAKKMPSALGEKLRAVMQDFHGPSPDGGRDAGSTDALRQHRRRSMADGSQSNEEAIIAE
jgi:hypothetical protein